MSEREPSKVAREIAEQWRMGVMRLRLPRDLDSFTAEIQRAIEQAVEQARAEEREECARLAERYAHEIQYNPAGLPETAKMIREVATFLRARGEAGDAESE